MSLHTLLLTAALTQAPAPEKLDVAAYQKDLKVLTDGQKHYLVYESGKPAFDGHLFYGDGKTFTQQRVRGGGSSGDESFDVVFWDPRSFNGVGGTSEFLMKDSGKSFEVSCGKKTTSFKPVADEVAGKLVGSGTFTGPSWTRLPEVLLRDDKGNYYFVDRLRTEEALDRRDFRLFIGARGKVKQYPLKDIVDDTEGMIFSTKNGELRLITSSMKWVQGKAETALTAVPLDEPRNVRLVYLELGVYDGQRLGTPCDDLY